MAGNHYVSSAVLNVKNLSHAVHPHPTTPTHCTNHCLVVLIAKTKIDRHKLTCI